MRGMKRKSAGMRKAIENGRVFHKRCDRSPVFFLIEEITSLLAMHNVDTEFDAVFRHNDIARKFPAKQSGFFLKTLQPAHRRVAALVDCPRFQFLI